MYPGSNQISPKPFVLFIKMNSFMASCEQQANYGLRGRALCICAGTDAESCIIATSIEATKHGIQNGMRLSDAVRLCPQLVPLESNMARYREFQLKIVNVLKRYSRDVVAKELDEIVVRFNTGKALQTDLISFAKKIKQDITDKVSDHMKCRIGIAPTAYLAELAASVDNPNEITLITPENIDLILSRLQLKDIPGMSRFEIGRLREEGLETPLQLRSIPKRDAFRMRKNMVVDHWYSALNFFEVETDKKVHRSIQVMRRLSDEQRSTSQSVEDVFLSLCVTLEKRMAEQQLYSQRIGIHVRYGNGERYDDETPTERPLQNGIAIMQVLKKRMMQYSEEQDCGNVLHSSVIGINVYASDFLGNMIQHSVSEDNSKLDEWRKEVFAMSRNRKISPAAEPGEEGYR